VTRPPAELVRDLRAGVLPWCLYGIAAGFGQTLLGAVAAAAALVGLRLRQWREVKLPDLAIVTYFLGVAIDECCLGLGDWRAARAALLPTLLAAVALGSSILGFPFTLQYARQMVGPDWWHDRHFLRVNYILTAVWGLSFVMAAVMNFLTAEGPVNLRIIAAVLGLGLLVSALCFTRAYPRWYRLHRYLPRVRAGLEPYRRAPRHF